MFSDRRTVLALVAVALFLGACGQLPQPFARDGDEITTPEAMHPADGAGVVVDASRCAAAAAPALADAVIDALRHLGVTNVEMPCTSQRVWRAIQEAKGNNPSDRRSR